MIHIVLYEPEIPQNTGNIMRTCMAFHCVLHLIEPLGFTLDEKHLRRSGLDYRDSLEYHCYPNWETFCKTNKGSFYYVTRYGKKTPSEFQYSDEKKIFIWYLGKKVRGFQKRY